MTTDNGMSATGQINSEKSSGEMLTCPNCGLQCDSYEDPCPRCGHLVAKGPDTLQVDSKALISEYARQLRGDAFVAHPNPVTFEIDGQRFTLPPGDSLIVGRRVQTTDPIQPDVDLSRFSAAQKGVSRTHMRLMRRSNLIYISDMESRNGTWLNGKRLSATDDRLVRDGDQVQLGKLKIVVRF